MSLRVWLPLNRDLRNQGLENASISSSYMTLSDSCHKVTNNTPIPYAPDLDNSCLSFGGWFKFNKSEIASVLENSSDITSTRTTPGGNLLGNSATGASGGIGLCWSANTMYPNMVFNTMNFKASIRNTTNNNIVTSSYNIDFDIWIHLFVVYDVGDKTLKIYKNGELLQTKTNTPTTFSVRNLIIDYASVYSGNGPGVAIPYYTYDVRIYDHALSKKEVAELARGCVLHYPMNDTNSQILENVFNYPTFDNSDYQAGWLHWASEGASGYGCSQNTNKDYIWNKSNTYSHKFWCTSGTLSTSHYLLYQVPEYPGGYRSAQAIIKMEDGSVPDKTKINWGWNNGINNDSVIHEYIPLGDNFYLMRVNGFQQDGANDLVGINIWPGNSAYVSEAYLENYKQVCSNILSQTHGSPNLNTANWYSHTPYWTIESQTLTEIKLKKNTSTTSSTVALYNGDITGKIKPNEIISVSGYFYKGDSPYQTTASSLSSYGNIFTTISKETRADGYFRYIGYYNQISSTILFHTTFFDTCTDGQICYIRNLDIHITPYLKDVSGFDNHSLITGSLPLVTTPKSPRYDKCMNIDNSGTNKNYANCTIAAPQVKSASFWVYIGGSFPSGTQILYLDKPSQLGFGFYQNTYCILASGGTNSNITCQYTINDKVKLNSWNHFCYNLNAVEKTTELWINGAKMTSPTANNWSNTNTNFDFGRRVYNNSFDYYTGQVSDFRLFSRVLTQADVDDLYKDSLSIDKSQNGYCYELNESDAQSSVDVKKNGQLKCKNYSEQFDGLYLYSGTYVITDLYYSAGDTCKAETFIKYDSGGSGRDLMGFGRNSGEYFGVTSDGSWESNGTITYSNADITKYNRVCYEYTCPSGDTGGNYVIGGLGGYGESFAPRNKTIYHVKLWKNGVLKLDLWPCEMNGILGLIDIITGVFYMANHPNASLVSGAVEAKIGKTGLVQANQMNEY